MEIILDCYTTLIVISYASYAKKINSNNIIIGNYSLGDTFTNEFMLIDSRFISEDFNRYRRGLETCPQAKTSKSGHAIFFSFVRRARATNMTQRRVEKPRVHFWTFSPVSVNSSET